MAQLEEQKTALIRELDQARSEISAHSLGARAHANPGAKLRASFARNRIAWIGGAALLGLVLAKLPPRTRKVPVSRKTEKQLADAGKAGIALGALKIAFDLARPFATTWATNRLGEMAKNATYSSEPRR